MKRFPLSCLLVLAALALAACAQPPAMPGSDAAPTSVSAVSSQSTAAAASSSASGTPVAVTLSEDRISSSLTRFQIGVPYTFLIKNAGPHDACFDVSAPVAVTGSYAASAASALLSVREVDLPAGRQTAASLTFPDSTAGRPMEFSCLMRRHYDDGMRLQITVTK